MRREPIKAEELAEMSRKERADIRIMFEDEFESFAQWVFPLIEGFDFRWTLVQAVMSMFLEDVSRMKILRGIINVKPRFGKSTLIAMWIAWWLIRRPRCRFLYLSSSDILVRELSGMVKYIIRLPEVQCLWNINIAKDATRSDLWRTDNGGFMRAVSLAGQVIGFGAGQLGAEDFRGCIIIDDPNKPDAVGSMIISPVILEKINGIYKAVVKNRINDPKTPIIIVQQRLDDNDLSGFLLNGGSGEIWYHVRIPALVERAEEDLAAERYGTDWSFGRPYDFEMPTGFVWTAKHGQAQDDVDRLDMDTYAAQSMQNPRQHGGSLFRTSWLGRYDGFDVDGGVSGRVWYHGEEVLLRSFSVFADTACKKGEENDWSVFQLWGIGLDGGLYLLDLFRDKLEAPELQEESEIFLKRYADRRPRKYGWREVYIEDKSSGIGLIQQLKRTWGARVIPVPRGTDKVSRALSCLIPLKDGLVRIPANSQEHPWVGEFLTEYAAFSKMMTHAHDDQMDPMFDAIEKLGKSGGKTIYDVTSTDDEQNRNVSGMV